MALQTPANQVAAHHRLDGRWSWVVLFCATVCQTINLGIMRTFGVFFPVIIKRLDSSRERTAWIGSGANALFLLAGPLTAALCDRFGFLLVAIIGGLLCSVGLLLTSFATEMVHYYLAYSLLFGLGGCCIRTSSFLIIAKYFYKQRALATGILTSAGGLGVFAFGPVNQQLIDKLGLDNTYRVLAGVCLLICIAALTFHSNVQESENNEEFCEITNETEVDQPRKTISIDCSVWKVPVFVVMVITFTMGIPGVVVPPQHLVKYCQELGFSTDSAANLFTFMGIASCFSRIASGRLCDITWINPRYAYQIGTCMNGVVICLLAIGRSYIVFVVLSISFGITEGISMAVSNLILLNVVEERRRASAMGLANGLMSVSVVGGSPLVGLMADQLGSYEPAFYTLGSLVLFAASFPFILLCLPPTGARTSQLNKPIKIKNNVQSPGTAGENTGVEEYYLVTSV